MALRMEATTTIFPHFYITKEIYGRPKPTTFFPSGENTVKLNFHNGSAEKHFLIVGRKRRPVGSLRTCLVSAHGGLRQGEGGGRAPDCSKGREGVSGGLWQGDGGGERRAPRGEAPGCYGKGRGREGGMGR